MKIKVYTQVGLLTTILVPDEKQSGYTAFFKEKEWDNLITEGDTIDDAIKNLLSLLDVVIKYKKDRKAVVNFIDWMWNYNVKRNGDLQGKWFQQDHGYIKDSEALYDVFVGELNRFKEI